MKRLVHGYIIISLGVVLQWMETEYFGNNFYPASLAESVCDLACLFIVVYGAFIVYRTFRHYD